MRKLLVALLLSALTLAFFLSDGYADEAIACYTARMRVSSSVYADIDNVSEIVGGLTKGNRVSVYNVGPAWARVSREGVEGFVRRSCLEDVAAIDPVHTPPYGVEVNRYIACVNQDAPVKSVASADGDTLVTLHRGAWISFISIDSGWGKLVYHRQYAYVDTRFLQDLLPVYGNPAWGTAEAPVAAYTSFYKLTEDDLNRGRMMNISAACGKMSSIILKPGESFDFNNDIGPYSKANGYTQAPVLVDGQLQPGYGGGTCQVSSTLYNVVLQLPGIQVLQRRAHGASGASYLPHGMDAAVGNDSINFRFLNNYDFPVGFTASAQDGALYISIYRVSGH
jgi:hypothetical protein